MANEVSVKLSADSKSLDQELRQSQDSIQGWANSIKGAIAGLAVGYGLKKLFDIGTGLAMSADEDARAMLKLETVINNVGDSVGFTTDQFGELAKQAQKYHGVADDVYLSNAAIVASFKNVRDVNIDRTIIMAADMAEILGGDVSAAAEKLGRALNEPAKGMKMLEKEGIVWTEEQEKMVDTMLKAGDVAGAQGVILEELGSRFGGASANAVQTFGGRIEQLQMAFGDMGESIGGLIIPILEALLPPVEAAADYIGSLVEQLSESSDMSREWADSWGEYFVGMLQYGIEVAADVFSLMEFIWKNFGTIVEREAFSWTLSVVGFVEDIKHFFTEVAPAYIEWFFDNWANLLMDYANFQVTVYSNMWKNVVSFFEGVWSWLSGGEGSFEWTALTDGFEATTKKLPEIADRNLTDFEKYLKNDIERMDNELGKSWNNIFDTNRGIVKKMFEGEEPPVIEPKVSKEGFVTDVDKLKDKTEKEVKPKIKTEVETELGKVVGLEDLGKQISEGGKTDRDKARQEADKEMEKQLEKMAKDKDGVKVRKPGAAGAGGAGADGADGGEEATGGARVARKQSKTLDDLYQLLADHQPQLIQAVNRSGALA